MKDLAMLGSPKRWFRDAINRLRRESEVDTKTHHWLKARVDKASGILKRIEALEAGVAILEGGIHDIQLMHRIGDRWLPVFGADCVETAPMTEAAMEGAQGAAETIVTNLRDEYDAV